MNKRIHPFIKGITILLMLGIILWVLCSNIHLLFSKPISLHQSVEEICQIEFVYSPRNENQIIHKLDESEYDKFLESLLDLKCLKRTSPSGHHGSLYVQITYYDDSVDILGSSSLRYISSDIEDHNGWYYLLEEDLYKLFSEYTDLSALSNLECSQHN